MNMNTAPDKTYAHIPVLLNEAIVGLAIKKNGIYIDGTFGRGGHSRMILEHLGDITPEIGRLIAIDRDEAAVNFARQTLSSDTRFTIVRDSFAHMHAIAETQHVRGQVDGILLDVGVSSPQFDDASRGFSFQADGPLDMRMDQTQSYDAENWVNHAPEAELASVFFEYGEEQYSRRIAKAIVLERAKQRITRTGQLADIIKTAHPRWEQHKHPATRCFQAIRIFINQELAALEQALRDSLAVLKPGGRLVVISFHSLEDRIVKQFIEYHSKGKPLPRHIPIESTQKLEFKKVGKAIKASVEEIEKNVRARSAVLRIAEKL